MVGGDFEGYRAGVVQEVFKIGCFTKLIQHVVGQVAFAANDIIEAFAFKILDFLHVGCNQDMDGVDLFQIVHLERFKCKGRKTKRV